MSGWLALPVTGPPSGLSCQDLTNFEVFVGVESLSSPSIIAAWRFGSSESAGRTKGMADDLLSVFRENFKSQCIANMLRDTNNASMALLGF